MFDGKFITTLLALVVAVIAICNFNTNKVSSNESFGFGGLPSMTWKVNRMVAANKEAVKKGDFYSIPGTFQANITPRFDPGNHGAYIRQNMPDKKNLAAPRDPLTFANMANENYHKNTIENYGCGVPSPSESFHAGAPLMNSDFASGNYNEMVEQSHENSQYPELANTLPVETMTSLNADGNTVNTITFDRFMVSNRQSRLRSQGDMIRGDLPIAPCTTGWFRPSANPNVDLQLGAMAVMGGLYNDNTTALAELINTTSGRQTISGIDMASDRNINTDNVRDINVVAFA